MRDDSEREEGDGTQSTKSASSDKAANEDDNTNSRKRRNQEKGKREEEKKKEGNMNNWQGLKQQQHILESNHRQKADEWYAWKPQITTLIQELKEKHEQWKRVKANDKNKGNHGKRNIIQAKEKELGKRHGRILGRMAWGQSS